jgi:hypothetical protein
MGLWPLNRRPRRKAPYWFRSRRTFAAWYKSEKTLSIHTIYTTRRQAFY